MHGYASPHAGLHTPPPAGYGFGPRPNVPPRTTNASPGPYPGSSAPPSTTAPGGGPPLPRSDNPADLRPLFVAANTSHTGQLSEPELGRALVNGDYSPFDPATVHMMVRMFDRSGNGAVGFEEFVALWRFLAAWRNLFDRFDTDRSGRISLDEFSNSLVAFGYRLSPPFVGVIYGTFEARVRRQPGTGAIPPVGVGAQVGMSFDVFVQACLTLKRMTDVFRRYDDDRDGYITVSFEEFLTG